MDINTITGAVSPYQNASPASVKPAAKTEPAKKAEEKQPAATGQAAVYDRDSVVVQMKNDLAQRTTQMQDMVRKMMTDQAGIATSSGNDIWKFLAKGNYTVTADVKTAAQEAVSENGYWGVNQTSERIFQFAQALSDGDSSKGKLLLDAVKKGFKKATGAWGKELPDISQKTLQKVEEKFENWMNPKGKTPEKPDTDPTKPTV